ncbi:TIGR04255 family protein [Bradyrhizobium sp. SZCCHNRI1009]|uniref:TIGR04255 family protein n=1 Tax=Bradyrhizobium sp. SZCCHNRI1009 TaxID=3057277 RepID=UPI002916C08B|nr:TIGR04255 family protein [Bradyrhizobium sp. SZCCHNRI1009]
MTEFVRPHYERAPIAEALIDVRVANPDAITLDQLTSVADALAEEFPIRHPIQHLMFGFQAATPEAATGFMNTPEQVGWRLHNGAQDRILQLQRVGFSYSHLPPYTDWDSFRNEARRHWQVFQRVVNAQSFSRVAVRVINKIPTPTAEVALQDYLSVYPVVPDNLPVTADAVFVQLQLGMPKILQDARAILNVASGQADANGSHLLLDIDLFANRIVERDDEVWSILEKFGLEKDVIFEACITDKIRKAIQ